MSLRVCEETGDRSGYDRDDFGSAYSSKEDEIVASLPQIDGQVYTPYTCTLFDIEPDGTAATDIEHPPVPMIYETTSLLRLVSGRGGFDG